MLSTMSGDKILKIISCRNTLRFGGSEEVLHDGICVVSEGNFDWALKAMDVPVLEGQYSLK
jgi:hypothetical protein